jgi:lipoic acid synthetase
MILGDICTRDCRYCNIKTGKPLPLDSKEPQHIAEAVEHLNLNYAVITCVTRDDLKDSGAQQFADTVHAIRRRKPDCKVELLISDLNGKWDALQTILDSKPDVLNHNIEIMRNLFPTLRAQGDYDISLALLQKTKERDPDCMTKSGFMVGVGEIDEDITQTLMDLKNVGCDIITVGQYLQPSPNHYPVQKYYTTQEFETIKTKAKEIGIRHVIAGPLVRSSYRAHEVV